ncbi:MAG TPA: thioredoxin domain-containing protein [Blastocatellia bacterium]|nr:thioredoxin domain-containing protein [Blastocatellia bacterium]
MSGYVTEVNDANFESEVLESSQPVLVDFWAEWCQPCNVLAATVESLAEKYEDRLKVVKLNVDEGAGSSLLAFLDVFWLLFLLTLAAVPLVLLIKNIRRGAPAGAGH